MDGYGVLLPEQYGGQRGAAAVALGAQLVERHERLAGARVGARAERPAAAVVRKQSGLTVGPASQRTVRSGEAAPKGLRSGLAAVSLAAARTPASAMTPALEVALAAAKQRAALAGVRMLEAVKAEGTMAAAKSAEGKLAEARIP